MSPRDRVVSAPLIVALALVSAPGCKDKDKESGSALVPTAAPVASPTTAASAAPAVDPSQCPGCQLVPTPAWTFEGIYADAACTTPLAQMVTPACAPVPALGPTSITYVDAVGGRKAGETAQAAVGEQVAAAMPRYRKTGTGCARANEGAVDVTPPGCTGQKICRDQTGALACASCRTLTGGCPDFEETRLYATINDPQIKGAAPGAGGGGGGNLARLKQCCAALAGEAKRLGASPEAGVLASAAAQCNAIVAQAGPSGNAPELGALRTLMAGRNVPAVCAGF